MLTRLRVSGFKNLVDVDVRFGPFTCIAGANGTGKSNLFDAIHFLSALADQPLIAAALSVRDERGTSGDIRRLFHRVGDRYDEVLSFEAEMIVPYTGQDELGQTANATTTFLRYALELGYRENVDSVGPGLLEIRKEELTYIKRSDARRHLPFPHKHVWRDSALQGKGRTADFISTKADGGQVIIKQHQDGGSRGKPLSRSATNLPRTVLSTVNAAEAPTASLARREMQSWRLLQLEPSALRRPDSFVAPTMLGADGSHLASTLYRLGGTGGNGRTSGESREARTYVELANRLSQLIEDIWDVSVDRDEKRELLTLLVTDRDGTALPATALSDGTLRFLALAVLELDPASEGLICLEEPENGIHPERISAMLQLLQDIACDPDEPTGPDNPLRQVIINTHSPGVVRQVPDHSLLVAEMREMVRDERRFKGACFSPLPDTWRAKTSGETRAVPRGKVLAYLDPVPPGNETHPAAIGPSDGGGSRRDRRVIDREDFRPYLPGIPGLQ